MKSPYLSELEPNQTVQGTFLVSYKDVRQKKSGEHSKCASVQAQ